MSIFARLREFDAYTKPLDDFRVKTLSGGLVTLVSCIVMILLAISETTQYYSTDVVEQLLVDSTTSDLRVDINFDLTFPRLPCPFITVDVMDVASEAQENIQDDIYKLPLDSQGNNKSEVVQKIEVNRKNATIASSEVPTDANKCGSCYGALGDGACCNTCEDVRRAYEIKGWQVNIEEVEQCKGDKWVKTLGEHKDEGCRVYGKVQVAKVAGNFHLAPGDPFQSMRSHVHDLHSLGPTKFDTSHIVNHLSFGGAYPGKQFPLNGRTFDTGKGGVMYQYYVKAVPTSYRSLSGDRQFSYQFSVTSRQKDLSQGMSGLPGFFVQYEFSPLMVHMEERQKPLIGFLVSLCAIIGGVFTVAQLIDIFIYSSSRFLTKTGAHKLG